MHLSLLQPSLLGQLKDHISAEAWSQFQTLPPIKQGDTMHTFVKHYRIIKDLLYDVISARYDELEEYEMLVSALRFERMQVYTILSNEIMGTAVPSPLQTQPI